MGFSARTERAWLNLHALPPGTCELVHTRVGASIRAIMRSVHQAVPTQIAEITSEFVTAALQAKHPGARVRDVEVTSERSSTNHHAKLRLRYDERAGAPDTLFAKMASLDPAHRAMIGATGMGAREARFYRELAPSLSMRVPICHFAASAEDGAFLLLLEDLMASGCRTSDGSWGIDASMAAGGLTDLAALHVRYESDAALAAVRPWIDASPMSNIAFTTAMLRRVIDEHRSILADDYVAIGEMYIAQPERVLALWSHAPHTVVHGDAHLGNVFVDGARVGFLDWGLLAVAPAMRDVSYFLSLTMTGKERRASEGDLLQHYVHVRRSLGGSPLDLDEAWRAHRVHAGYLVLASFLSLVPPYNAPDQRAFSEAFRARATEAIEDLDAADSLRGAIDHS
jgi:hypothetical protein